MKWWQKAVVYQIYPRSFQDSNGDGIGDIRGIIERLDYLEKLGINAIWLSPVYQSPNDDNGYDISDYEAIHPEFGTMEDMNELIAEAQKRSIRIVMDLVVNHTSDEHHWFQEAKKGKDSPYRDYYIWRDPVKGKEPNDLKSTFSGSAWAYDKTSDQYYLHLFSEKQPDLNWENEKMRQDIYNMMNFWLEKGIGGFRMDVIDLIGKKPDEKITGNGPRLHEFLQEMNRKTFGHYDVMTVGETWSATPENAELYSGSDRGELSMIFQFEHIALDQEPISKWALKDLDLVELKQVLSKWQIALGETAWNSLFWNNHDTPRIVSRWGNDQAFRVESAKCFAVLLHLMKGTPYIYQGEEIGMTNRPVGNISEVNDIESINMYKEEMENGKTAEALLNAINYKGRDNARTPMQWNDQENGGFSTGEPWLSVNPNFTEINVEQTLADEQSVFYLYKDLIQYRKENETVVRGSYNLLLPDHQSVFVYERVYNENRLLVIANLSTEENTIELPEISKESTIRFSNYDRQVVDAKQCTLAPYECFVVDVK
ncbi:glycoside hydrolase family 13 protein [Marinilactibacillus psychrotolerans]|uniref:Oligo-1,6-glucosidase n=1 Tax=Marinilactibacillus psychrotolerans TaxID=191770 RepID=A0AAV3WV89_9LACT|nr:alpha-glucosidase [Marinilactibacillus psychrotolerans]GEL67495.1 alpha-glucosidase [Marinilactibacillus psychrotolerans]GEQ35656.1 oligo-1,6-glucosidase [Marinilactibacillus psychrotolerans]SDC72390.1 glucan 1,6-alpha-glucosidase [Marinilactibacillus psychrotolerans]